VNAVVNAAWCDYANKIYPQPISNIQEKECSQAFYAGFAIALEKLSAIAAKPEDEAVVELEALHKDVEACLASLLNQKRRN
jgi:hypothetical protein